ncbi:MAG: hypothetical protein EU533_06100 [Promethearchaeota archaeon]|nr:MAG: hypothetical protein EU533_06100 [Candidatus Lokiarchaeota archaeon]
MTKFNPVLRTTPTGLLSYDLGADYMLLFPLATKLQNKFGLEAEKLPIFGLDQIFLDLNKGALTITIGWDIWSDLFIMALDENANELVKEIAGYIDTILEELEELEDKLIAEHKENEKDEIS